MIVLRAAPYRALINPHGASLAELSCDGRDLVVPQDGEGGLPMFRGAVLAPWPNRVHDGRYEFGGTTYEVPINEPARNAALHGLVFDRDWQVQVRDVDRTALTVSIEPQGGYPSALRLRIEYVISADGLAVTLHATNIGARAAPYGCGFHPYFTSAPTPVDDVTLRIDAERHLDVTPDRMLPISISRVHGAPYDLTGGRVVGEQHLDDAYTDVGHVGLVGEPFGEVQVWREDNLPWLQAFTPPGRRAVALEPCTCPEDAYRSGTDLVVLEPEQSHTARWGVRVLSA